jgi:UDP-hydrolysing UDP-N-acetyl-D-glucosamine 2-epimerase
MKKILVFSAIRSEYDLLSSLFKLLHNDADIDLQFIISGAHLSPKYDYSVKEIEKDGYNILAKIETLIDADTKSARIKSGAILFQNAINIVQKYNPDMILFAGDREEVIIAALIGGYLEIPTVHFYGGDHVEDSHIDNPVRHATSKLSTIHMVSTEEHRLRLLRMGEVPKRIFNIGSIALDRFINEKKLTKDEIKKAMGITKGFETFALVIFHPIPKERKKSAAIFRNLLQTLKKFQINAFVGYPNIDPGSYSILDIINEFDKDTNFIFYKNLDRTLFLSIYKESEFIIGNSSSGVLESASVPIPAINIGVRQTGRLANKNVLFINDDLQSIENTIEQVRSQNFSMQIKDITNIYGDGKSALKAYKIIKENDFKDLIFKNEDPLKQEQL